MFDLCRVDQTQEVALEELGLVEAVGPLSEHSSLCRGSAFIALP